MSETLFHPTALLLRGKINTSLPASNAEGRQPLLQAQMQPATLELGYIPLELKDPLTTIIKKQELPVITPIINQTDGYFLAIITGLEERLAQLANILSAQNNIYPDLGKLIKKALLNKGHKPETIKLGNHVLQIGERTIIMGILNMTPDSFSDGGKFYEKDEALAQAYAMAQEGADIIDIGGESSRPGYIRVSADEELSRILPLIKTLKADQSFHLPISVDTYKEKVARAVLEEGADLLNDIWGLKYDSELKSLASDYNVPICLMHNRNNTNYNLLIHDIINELEESIEIALQAGFRKENIIIDPGIGFGKTVDQNLAVMNKISMFNSLGYPLLLGTSRKSLIGKTLDLPVDQRLEGTAATLALGINAGVNIVRVHDVKLMKRVTDMTDAIIRR